MGWVGVRGVMGGGGWGGGGVQCNNQMSCGPTFADRIRLYTIGEHFTIQDYSVKVSTGDCVVRNGVGYMAYPDGTQVTAITNYAIAPPTITDPGCISCNGTACG